MKYRELLKYSGLLLSAQTISSLVNLGKVAVMTRLLSQADVGVFAVAQGTALMFGDLVLPQYGEVLRKDVARLRVEDPAQLPQTISRGIIASLVLGLLLALLLIPLTVPLMIGWYQKPEAVMPFVYLIALVPVAALLRIAKEALRILERFRLIAVVEVSQAILNTGLTILLLLSGLGLKAPVLALLLATAGCFGLSLLGLLPYLRFTPPLIERRSWVLYRPLLAASLIKIPANRLQVLIVGRFLSLADNGLFWAATRLIAAVFGAFDHYIRTAQVACVKSYHEQRAQFDALLNRCCKHLAVSLALVGGGLALAANLALVVVSGKGYGAAAGLVALLAGAACCSRLTFIQRVVLIAFERSRYYVHSILIYVFVLVLALVIFVPLMGLLGAGLAGLLGEAASLVAALYFSRLVGARINLRLILGPWTLAALSLAVFGGALAAGLPQVVAALGYAVLFGLLLNLTGMVSRERSLALFREVLGKGGA